MALFVSGKLFNKAGEGSGGGGGDQHNLGYFATQAALEEAYPTATAGDWAIVGSTDTVWIWDEDNSEWVDSDQKGQVTSVNGQTGAVVITPSSIGALENEATGLNSLSIMASTGGYAGSVAIGKNCSANEGPQNVVVGADTSAYRYGVALGQGSRAGNSISGADSAVAIGHQAKALGTNSIQLGRNGTNSDANTFKVANANGNYEIMSADGTIPEARLADTTNATAGQALVLDSQGNAVWSDVSSSPTTAPALIAANWSNNQQTVNVTGVTETNAIIVAPIPTDAQDYASAGILCIGQGAGTLTFSCVSVPANDLQVNVLII